MSDSLDPHEQTGIEPAAESAEPEIKVSEDGNQITRGERTYIPLEAVKQARSENQQLRQIVDQIAPYQAEFAEFLNNKRSGRANAERVAAPATDETYSDEELKGVASLRGYYTEDGQSLDLDRARRDLDLTTRIADRTAQKAVAPVQRTTTATNAAKNRQDALTRNYSDGTPVAGREYVEQLLNLLPDDYMADESSVNATLLMAAGMEYLNMRKEGKIGTRREPQHFEGSTGITPGTNRPQVSAFSQKAAQARGVSLSEWQKGLEKAGKRDRDGGVVLETGL